jgi:hypothetical protein
MASRLGRLASDATSMFSENACSRLPRSTQPVHHPIWGFASNSQPVLV